MTSVVFSIDIFYRQPFTPWPLSQRVNGVVQKIQVRGYAHPKARCVAEPLVSAVYSLTVNITFIQPINSSFNLSSNHSSKGKCYRVVV